MNKNLKRKICFITGSRAEYGLLRPLMAKVRADETLCLQIIATTMHMSPEFGLTHKEIENDGFLINKKIETLLSSDTSVGISKSMGLTMISVSEALEDLRPDLVVLIGDRFETFAAASSALVSRLPIAHLYGGEITEGAFDDAMRHSITKMSHLHFTSTEVYRKRIIQLGEDPASIFNVGAIGIDNIKCIKLLKKNILEKELSFKFGRKNLIVTYHPVTLEYSTSLSQFGAILKALDGLKDTNLIFTKPNADVDGRIIINMIDEYVSRNRYRAISATSLGQLKYLSVLQFVDAVVGNSSSGIIEAPSFQIGTINIGDRQKGRVRAQSVIDCPPETKSIEKAILRVYSEEFQSMLKNTLSPFGDGTAAIKIKKILKKFFLKDILKKKFNDIDF